jgi:stringent starvation protein B
MSDDAPQMTSHRPYLLRALNEWIIDNGLTPHLLVDAGHPGVQVPTQAINDGKVVLNIADRAVTRLAIDNDTVSFTARFGGVSHAVLVPVSAVLAIYARENGQGMALPEDIGGSASTPPPPDSPDPPPDDGGPPPRRGHLRVIK